MARTAIQVHAINLIELGQGKSGSPFEPVMDANCRLVAPPPTRRTAIGGYPKVASYDMLGEQLHHVCVAMTVYQGKTEKNVAILSTFHQNIIIADNAKKTPESVKAYNDTKYGVDIVDQMERKYTVGTSTKIWLIHLFQNTLDLAAINA